MKKTTLIRGLSAVACLTLISCGQLSKERLAELDRQNGIQNVTANQKVSAMNWNSTSAPDLQYRTTFDAAKSEFTVLVTRANNVAMTKLVTITKGESTDEYDFLATLFIAKAEISTCGNCSTIRTLILEMKSGATTTYHNPLITTATGSSASAKELDRFNQFILNHL